MYACIKFLKNQQNIELLKGWEHTLGTLIKLIYDTVIILIEIEHRLIIMS